MEEVLQNLNRGIQGLRLADRQQALMNLSKFSGRGDARTWLDSFTEAATYAHTNEADKIRLMPLLLTGSALQWYRALPDADKADWETFTQAYERRFLPEEEREALRKLAKLSLSASECIADYAGRCVALFEKTVLNEEQKLHYFLEGLPSSIRSLVIMQDPETVADAITLAKRAEKAKPTTDSDIANMVTGLSEQVSQLTDQITTNIAITQPRIQRPTSRQNQHQQYGGRRDYHPSRTSPYQYNWRGRRDWRPRGNSGGRGRGTDRSNVNNRRNHQRSPSPRPEARRPAARGNQRYGRFNTFQTSKSATLYNFNASPPCPDGSKFSPKNPHVGHSIHQNKWVYCRMPDNRHVKALLDTGAKFSAISEQFFNKICRSIPLELEKPYYENIVTATGDLTKIPGQIQIIIKIDGIKYPCAFHVVPNLTTPMILGECFLQHYNAHILYAEQKVYLTPPRVAYTAFSLSLPPQSETIVSLKLNSNTIQNTVGFMLPVKNPSYFVSNTLSRVDGNHVVTKILNPRNVPVQIAENKPIAHFYVLTPPKPLKSILKQPGRYPHKQKHTVSISHCTQTFRDNKCATNKTAVRSNRHIMQPNELLKHLDLSDSPISESQKNQLTNLILANNDVFGEKLSEIGASKQYVYPFRMKPDAVPYRSKPYRTNPKTRHIMESQIQELLDHDIIEPCNSPWNSNPILVKKPHSPVDNPQYRLCIDLRQVNKVTVPLHCTLPSAEQVFDAAGESNPQYYSSFDLSSAFNQATLAPNQREYTAFQDPYNRQFCYKRLPFGATNSPAVFETLLSSILGKLTWKTAITYLDDVLLWSPNWSRHLQDLQELFNVFRENNLTIKLSKSRLAKTSLHYLGHIISRSGIRADESKLLAIQNLSPPKNLKGLRAALGIFGYYRRYVPHFSVVAAPLFQLLKADVKYNWTPECQQAFETLKQALLKDIMLAYPNWNKEMRVYCDASLLGLGIAIEQEVKGQWRPVAFASRTLTDAEKRYPATHLECLACIYATQKFRDYLTNVPKFTFVTDHQALTSLLANKNPTGRLGRWVAHLSQFNFDIVYKKGLLHRQADGLSRLPVSHAENEPKHEEACPPIFSVQNHDLESVRKLLADTLRHNPVCAPDGYLSISEISYMPEFRDIPRPMILAAAENHRFKIQQNSWGEAQIKCHYGHTVTYPKLHSRSEIIPVTKVPKTLTHATGPDPTTAHVKVGIIRGWRTHLHMVPHNHWSLENTHKYKELFILDSRKMAEAGYKFYRSPDGVYTVPLDKTLPAEFILDHKTNEPKEHRKNTIASAGILAATKTTNKPECTQRKSAVQQIVRQFAQLKDIGRYQKRDLYCQERVSYLKKGILPTDNKHARKIILQSADLEIVDGVLCHKYYTQGKGPKQTRVITQVVIPTELVPEILTMLHDEPLSGHLAADKTTNRARNFFYWESMNSDIRNWCTSCDVCQMIKKSYRHYPTPLQRINIPPPLYKWHIDMAVNLPPNKDGYQHFMIMVEAFSGFIVTKPMKTQTAEEAASVVYEHIICTFGPPLELTSDNGKNFTSKVMSHLFSTYGISHITISPYNAKANSAAERRIQSVKQRLALHAHDKQTKWVETLPSATFALNTVPSSASHYSPFFYCLAGKQVSHTLQ
jgi:RNA:NAD 2'-phosphotransferase (TPT1/KptA family)